MPKLFSTILLLVLMWNASAYASSVIKSDIPYGTDPAQKLDIYLPTPTKNAPIILFVHGGGWRIGDKAMGRVVANKSAHYLGQGMIFVSMNYRMQGVTPLDEAQDVASALRYVQSHAAEWRGDGRIVLMGHSAGAHLVALISANPTAYQLKPWRGTVSLDSAAYDVPALMHKPHMGLYDDAFGTDTKLWEAASPLLQLKADSPPMLLVCSSQRWMSCPQAHAFEKKIKTNGRNAEVLEIDKTHMEINNDLGETSDYTASVDRFLASILH